MGFCSFSSPIIAGSVPAFFLRMAQLATGRDDNDANLRQRFWYNRRMSKRYLYVVEAIDAISGQSRTWLLPSNDSKIDAGDSQCLRVDCAGHAERVKAVVALAFKTSTLGDLYDAPFSMAAKHVRMVVDKLSTPDAAMSVSVVRGAVV